MADVLDSIETQIESVALALVTMDGEDIPAMGEMLNHLGKIKSQSRELGSDAFVALTGALEGYLEKVVLRETSDLTPFENGLEQLQRCFHNLCNGVEERQDLSDLFSCLGADPGGNGGNADEPAPAQPDGPGGASQEAIGSADIASGADAKVSSSGPEENLEYFDAPDPDPDEEDREIISGFVMESLDGLETVEVSLMELEENPDDNESINTIFRSFHTIKGVSAFLGFMRINTLAHRSENLLDKIRGGELDIQPRVVDVILDTVDLLKKLVQGVKAGMDCGGGMDCGLAIAPMVARIEAVQNNDDAHQPIGRIMIERGDLNEKELNRALETQKAHPDQKLGEILVAAGQATANQVASALQDQKKSSSRRTGLQVKVDTKKLDNLVDMAGELVIAQSMLRQNPHIKTSQDQTLMHTLGQLGQITAALQTMTMSLRMVPIKSTFQKMVRLVRDLARNSGKQVRLTMCGEDTEIDRNMVDELYEPMVHMIRNSVDHGLEPPHERMAAGKDPVGAIHLRAFHRGGNIVVEISDDGRGLNKERIIEKAKANGLITDEIKLPDDEINQLIFQPGFSTAREVSEISGRGVGMDVVKQAIEKLRGRVDIQTRPGKGSTFVISLPLTLAIIEGMVVRIGKDRYVIPAPSIIESFRPTRDQYSTVVGQGEMILTRGKLVPLVRLDRYFNCAFDADHPWQGIVVAVEYDGKRICLLLDELLGKEDVVIKSMGPYLQNVKGIAGGAIMGDGRVGLILDMAGVWQLANNSNPDAA
jgi:two-component system, chemotaxis family, sensor kinase CheA